MALNINGRMKVKTLKADFLKEFGLTLRVYDGRSFADDDATLASIRKGDSKGGEFSPRRNTKVGNLEDKLMELFGIKTQVAGSDDSYLCNNDLTLAAALDTDEKKMGKKAKKGDVSPEIEMDIEIESGFTSKKGDVVICEISNFISDDEDKNNKFQISFEQIEEFIDSVNTTLEGNFDKRMLMKSLDVEKEREKMALFENGFDIEIFKINFYDFINEEYPEELFLVLILTKDIPIDQLNEMFLGMDGYYGTIVYSTENGNTIYQDYQSGEYDSGYFGGFSSKEGCINDDIYSPIYKELKKDLIK